MSKPKASVPIEAVSEILSRADACLSAREPDMAGAAECLAGLSAHSALLAMPRYEGHARPLQALSECMARGDARGARRHLGRVARVLRPSSNDRPFDVGDAVSVTRTRHGWHDGMLGGTVKSRSVSENGTWDYVVKGEDGEDHEVERTRDMRPGR